MWRRIVVRVFRQGDRGHLVHVQTVTHGLAFLDAEAELRKYRTLFDRIEAMALDPEKSRELIHNVIRDL
ncbi:Scr1 family TA system antitoxin-like transcriptional regulator [Streptomyces sp. ME02-8801-2C]|uniref:Scr1 family TA system antitoxin-like transcriptional regulator n=1 Tax=Streptomyces sp. ME02-8801-2C TaxID=3028680 RepID=UPI0029C046D4|nr:Scr1 family TA system antitoxin-like transcriptional regulator [Streptomyces sp. ME02-8801-2C]